MNDDGKTLIRRHVWWGPKAAYWTDEEKEKYLSELFDSIDRGKPGTAPKSSRPQVDINDFLNNIK